MARTVDDLPDLATPKQVREILPLSDYQLRTLIRERRIGHVPIGARFLIPRESIREFIAKNTVSPCPDETKARASAWLLLHRVDRARPQPRAQHGHGRPRTSSNRARRIPTRADPARRPA